MDITNIDHVKRFRDWVKEIDWIGSIPFILMHASCLAAFWVGVSPVALLIFVFTLGIRIFGITGGDHRYFSHRSFETSRFFQFVLGFLGASSTQMGPLWWAAHHRHHHRHSDQEPDIHSPIIDTFLWSHFGWVMAKKSHEEDPIVKVPDLAKYPELRWLNKYYIVAGLVFLTAVAALGFFIEHTFPAWKTTAAQVVVWGFFISTVVLYHVTFTINSLSHVWGSRRYETNDDSRNNFFLSLLTMGEGWHNNHHKHCGTAKMGFFWWEVDVTYYILKMLSFLGIVWDLKPPPEKAYDPETFLAKKS